MKVKCQVVGPRKWFLRNISLPIMNTTFLFAIFNSNPIVIDIIVCNNNINDIDVGDNDINLGTRIIVPFAYSRFPTATDDKNKNNKKS
jgi:Mg2+/Co2+ transporter CorC